MAITVPALKGQMGSNVFYETKMRAKELSAAARVANEQDTWSSLSIEERLQRELNDKRVREEIVPYLAQAKDRFFGSIIVLIKDADIDFEGAGKYLAKDVPAAYRKTFEQTGALTIEGGEFVILDGQHRYAALRSVIQGKNDKGETVHGSEVGNVANDELIVIFLPWTNAETTRRIFNKINRNARPTGRSDNIITSEDDGNAILARKLLSSGEPLGTMRSGQELLVNWKSTTISPRSAQWTTISAVNESVIDILKSHKIVFSEKEQVIRPTEDKLDEAYEIVKEWWADLLEGVELFHEITENPENVAEIRKTHDAKSGLLLKPAAHIVLVKALIRAVERGTDRSKAISRLNNIDWSMTSELWRDLLVTPGGRIIARASNYDVSADLLSYMIGSENTDQSVRASIEKKVRTFRDDEEWTLPEPIS